MLPRVACRDHRGHHPWRHIGLYPDWTIKFVGRLPDGRLGLTIHASKTILILAGLTQAQRRSTLCHEVGHMLRGPASVCRELYEESLVERQAARLLLPSVRRVGHALAYHHADYKKTADDLWTDENLLNVRLSTLPPKDREWLRHQMDLILL